MATKKAPARAAKKAPPKRAPQTPRATQGAAKKAPTRPAPAKKAVAKTRAPERTSAPAKRGAASAPAAEVRTRLGRAIPEARCELAHRSGFELLIATILSAQSTDKMVNAVTPELFRRWPTPAALAEAPQEEVEEVVKRTGFFRNKAKSIRGAAQKIVAEYGGEVPRTLDELITLPGVARKTANVVLGTAYGVPSGFVVDTHVSRVSQRLGLTTHDEPVRIEQDLSAHFPAESWVDMGHRILLHGRYTCLARAPMCSQCPLYELCPSRGDEEPLIAWHERAEHEAARVDEGYRASGALSRGA